MDVSTQFDCCQALFAGLLSLNFAEQFTQPRVGLRLAQMELAAKHFDETIAACDRGLGRAPGANGRAWLLQIKARALGQKGKTVEARRALQEALQAAQEIPNQGSRDVNIDSIKKALRQ
jgi:predicted negative regulator of RcsB-dependent stress response